LLAREEAAGRRDGGATSAAARVYDGLNAQLVPLLGTMGVQALLARSVKLTARSELASLVDASALQEPSKLREWFEAGDPAVVADAAADVFGTFLTLLMTFIGERLTIHLLQSAWPRLEEPATRETKQ
jgi:hypothetical protein